MRAVFANVHLTEIAINRNRREVITTKKQEKEKITLKQKSLVSFPSPKA